MDHSKTYTLLAIDEDLALLTVLQQAMEVAGITVLPAASALEGLKLIRTIQVDTVLADVRTLLINGNEFIKTLAAEAESVPIVIWTEHPNRDTCQEMMRYGVVDYLAKQTPLDAVALVIKRAADLGMARRQLETDELDFICTLSLQQGRRFDEICSKRRQLYELNSYGPLAVAD